MWDEPRNRRGVVKGHQFVAGRLPAKRKVEMRMTLTRKPFPAMSQTVPRAVAFLPHKYQS